VSYALVGPFSFDLKTVVSSGRAALSEVARQLRQGRGEELIESGATGVDPGLYILVQHAGEGSRPVIAGFWVVIPGEYLTAGPLGPPDRVPPYARELLDAATEEVWWQNLEVNLSKDGVWRPLVILEWPSHIAGRSALAPPGVPFEEEEAADGLLEERETWLEAVDPLGLGAQRTDIPSMTYDKELDRYEGLEGQRSLIVIVRGSLRHDGRLHQGSYFMIPPEMYEDGTPRPLSLDDWMVASHDMVQADVEAIEPTEDERHQLGKPLQLFGDRVGFHASGWLTRNLGIWPARPSDVAIGTLTDRVVQQKWIAQARLALMSSLVVLTLVLSFSAIVQFLTRPVPEPMKPPPPPAPQPALSVCSADYQEFVEEFRCQLEHLAYREDDGGTAPVCGDLGSSERYIDSGVDLQPIYCALLDRERDGWKAGLGGSERANFGLFAAAQACFNVLGHPYPYRLREVGRETGGGRVIGDPMLFLEDEELSIRPLVQAADELAEACDGYRERVEARIEGAMFATHVGEPLADNPAGDSDAAKLRRAMLFKAMSSATSDVQACFTRGMKEGMVGERYVGLCVDGEDRLDVRAGRSKIWRKLDGAVPITGDVTLVGRYSDSRYAKPGTKVSTLWQCHLGLEAAEELVLGERTGAWEIPIPTPDDYNIRGSGAFTQLTLDAALRGFAEQGVDAGVCWQVVARRLSAYKPVHPLLADLDAEGWPSEEQQLCGQICAAGFGIRRSINDSEWVTRDRDLEQCVLHKPGPTDDMGRGRLDALRLPWNEAQRGRWVDPTTAQVCAFNVVAQMLMPEVEGGYIIEAAAPKEFAGETVAGSRIAGGLLGLAGRYVPGLAFARRDSVSSTAACGHVATQCFTSLLFEVTGDKTVERYRWRDEWFKRTEAITAYKRGELAETNPWCVGVSDYLMPERESAQFDTPCVKGVEEARRRTEMAIALLENDISLGGGQ
jgi:hypothetical protein